MSAALSRYIATSRVRSCSSGSASRRHSSALSRRSASFTVLAIDDGARARKALVTRRNGEPVAFAVDRMLGRHEVVVRPIDDPLVDVPGISGATDLGDGRPTLVLDLGELALMSREGAAS